MKTAVMRTAAMALAALVAMAGPASADPSAPRSNRSPAPRPHRRQTRSTRPAPRSARRRHRGCAAGRRRQGGLHPADHRHVPRRLDHDGRGKDEVQRAIAPLTTAISTREYQVSGTFTGSLKGPGGGPAKGVLEVGYQIGCGIEMTTGNGVLLSGNAGGAAGLGVGITPGLTLGDFYLPQIGGSVGGGVAVSLKPGLVNIVPITKKNFVGTGAVGVDRQLPDQDRRVRRAVLHPLLRHAGQVHRRRRRHPVLVRHHQNRLAGGGRTAPRATGASPGCHRRPRVLRSAASDRRETLRVESHGHPWVQAGGLHDPGRSAAILHWPNSGVWPPVQYGSVMSGLADAPGAVSTAVATSKPAAMRLFIGPGYSGILGSIR